jgi:hypothetical protein
MTGAIIAMVTESSSVRPAARWAASATTDVAVMIASEVPTVGRIEKARASVSVGTMRKPPPTPKKPVIRPISDPAARLPVPFVWLSLP